jgi:hypothetical protein
LIPPAKELLVVINKSVVVVPRDVWRIEIDEVATSNAIKRCSEVMDSQMYSFAA